MATRARTQYGPGEYDYLFKLIVVGQSGAGKSALVRRFNEDTFDPDGKSTIGVDFVVRTLEIDGKLCKLQVWDTAGQERFRTVTHNYYRNCDAILFVFALDDEDTLRALDTWEEEARRHHTGTGSGCTCVQVYVGTKADAHPHAVARADAEAAATEHGRAYFETSARTNAGIDDLFSHIAHTLLAEKRTLPPEPAPARAAPGHARAVIDLAAEATTALLGAAASRAPRAPRCVC